MSAETIISQNRIVTEIHLVWDGHFYFLNRIRPASPRPESISAQRAAEIIRLNEGEPGVEISTSGKVEIGSKHSWSWMAKITTVQPEEETAV